MTGFETIITGFVIGALVPYALLRLVLSSPYVRQRAWEHVYRNYPVDLVTGRVR